MKINFPRATIWQDAIPMGNGNVGALLFGGAPSEQVLLNHENLWLPVQPRRPLKNSADAYLHVLELAAQGRYDDISCYFYDEAAAYKDKGLYWPDPFSPGCQVFMDVATDAALEITRTLDLARGVCETT